VFKYAILLIIFIPYVVSFLKYQVAFIKLECNVN
jgi:hypothetical protein